MISFKEVLKRVLLGTPLGIAIGATITLIIATVMDGNAGDPYFISINFYIASYIASAVIGASFGATSLIWESEKLSLRTQTILHFFITIVVHLGCALGAGWVPLQLAALLIYAGIYVVLYGIIFVTIYNVQKKRVDEVNKALQD